MRERRGECVQTVPCLVLDREGPVEPVVHDVQSREGELCADLVGDAGEYRHLEKRALLVLDGCVSNGLELRDGAKGFCPSKLGRAQAVVVRVDHPAEGERRVVDEVVLKRAADADGTFDKRELRLLHGLGGELGAQV